MILKLVIIIQFYFIFYLIIIHMYGVFNKLHKTFFEIWNLYIDFYSMKEAPASPSFAESVCCLSWFHNLFISKEYIQLKLENLIVIIQWQNLYYLSFTNVAFIILFSLQNFIIWRLAILKVFCWNNFFYLQKFVHQNDYMEVIKYFYYIILCKLNIFIKEIFEISFFIIWTRSLNNWLKNPPNFSYAFLYIFFNAFLILFWILYFNYLRILLILISFDISLNFN